MSNTNISDELLVRLFQRHFPDAASAVLRLENHLAAIPLLFDFKTKLREVKFIPQPALPNGMPSFIYYFVPNSGWGSDQKVSANLLDTNFVKACDGVGLNLGCPVRLLRALDALAQLDLDDQKEIEDSLANSTQHLATIEELLWTTVWKSPSDIRRGGTIPGAKGNVDWTFKSCNFPFYLEAKFRPSDWPRLSDQGTFVPMSGSFLGKVANKFPNSHHEPELYLAGITTFENLTEDIFHQIGQELEANPQIDGVIFRSLIQMTHVLSLNVSLRNKIIRSLITPSTKDYPTNYAVLVDIKRRNERVSEQMKKSQKIPRHKTSRLFCWGIQPQLDAPVTMPILDAYRLNIISRGTDGEPCFEVIPKYIV
ncbi:MAG TPA: hypothetical protein VIK53_09970 [Verrucomicrobiae bacterium]